MSTSLRPSDSRTANLLRSVVDIRAGEGAHVAHTTLVLFGLVAAHTVLETARDALFLTTLSARHLTAVYAGLAVLGVGVASLTTMLVRTFGRVNALLVALLLTCFGTTVFYLLPTTPASVYGLYLWSGLVGPALAVQFWLLAGQVFTTAQGKRLFAFLGAGGTLGAVVGAVVAERLLAHLPVHTLIAAAIALQVVTALALPGLGDSSSPSENTRATPEGSWTQGLAVLFRHAYLRRIAIMVALSTAALLTTDYLFKSTIASTYRGAELGLFLARYYAVLNSIALVVQVFVAMRVVQRVGTVPAVAILPLFLLADGMMIALAGGGLSLVLLAKGADGTLRHSLHKVATELLYLPLQAADSGSARPFIDTVVSRGTQALMALLLLALAAVGLDNTLVLASIIAVLSAAWFVFTWTLRTPYLDLFRDMLGRSAGQRTVAFADLDLRSVGAVLEALSSPDQTRVIAAMDLLAEANRSSLIPALILYHDVEAVLVRALEILPASDRRDWIPLTEKLLRHASPKVRVHAVRALSFVGKPGAQTPISSATLAAIEDDDPNVRAQLAFALAEREAGDPAEHRRVRAILNNRESDPDVCHALVRAIAADGRERWGNALVELAETNDPRLAPLVVLAMAKVRDPRFVPSLVQQLAVREGRNGVRTALADIGAVALAALDRALYAEHTPPRVRLHIPRAIARFGSQAAVDRLLSALESDLAGVVRFKALRGLGRLTADNPELVAAPERLMALVRHNLIEHLRLASLLRPVQQRSTQAEGLARTSLELVGELLQSKMKQALERASRLLQIRHPKENIVGLFAAQGHADKRVRANAVEFLDALLLQQSEHDRELARIVADDHAIDERLARAQTFVPNQPADCESALAIMLGDPDETLAALAAHSADAMSLVQLKAQANSVFKRYPSLISTVAE